MRKTTCRVFTFLICLLLSSCFDVREEIWIEADGSGRAELTYHFPPQALLALGGITEAKSTIQGFFDKQPDLTLDHLSLVSANGETTLQAAITVRSMLSLLKLKDSESFKSLPPAATDFVGAVQVKVTGNQIDFSRAINLRKALGFAALGINSTERANRRLTYIVHLPAAADSHNATRVVDGGRTLVWEKTLGDALEREFVSEFTAQIPLPWWWLLLLVLLLGLMAAVVLRLRSRRRVPGANG